MYIRYNNTSKYYEYDTSVNQDGSGPWSELVIDASQIAQGKIALARGGTNADLSATGGTSQVLRQSSAGAAISVSQLVSSDLGDRTTQLVLTLQESHTYSDSLNHNMTNNYPNIGGIIKISSSAGFTFIPVYSNGGSGIGYHWTVLDPDTGWVINGNGISFSFTDGSGTNTYSFAMANGSGQMSIQRTAGTADYTFSVYTWS